MSTAFSYQLSAISRPPQVPPQIRPPLPRKSPEIGEADLFRVEAPIGFHAPSEIDRKSTRLNSSHLGISYAVFCLKKKRPQFLFTGGRMYLRTWTQTSVAGRTL